MKLIVIEGLDGSGKSTQINNLRNYFTENGLSYEFIHFPRTNAPYFGELISRFLRGEYGQANEVDPYLVAMLYAGDRKDISEKIYSWLGENKYVLLDRYVYSNIAYQCAKINNKKEREDLKNWIYNLEFKHFAIPVPALNIFLDVPFEFTASKLKNSRSGLDRNYLNGNMDIHESNLEFQKKVRQVYIDTAENDKTLQIIDCSQSPTTILPPDEVFQRIINLLHKNHIIA
ncbi:MAG TPA: dTMP kinase [Bacteroidales bacterium]|nr:dTMP kinase [Bacteroidales bacterium]